MKTKLYCHITHMYKSYAQINIFLNFFLFLPENCTHRVFAIHDQRCGLAYWAVSKLDVTRAIKLAKVDDMNVIYPPYVCKHHDQTYGTRAVSRY